MKKILSVILVFVMLFSALPITQALEENVIALSALETTVVGYKENGEESIYSITDCYGRTGEFGEKNQYNYYTYELGSIIDYKVSASEAGKYNIKMLMAGFYDLNYAMNVYVDECLAVSKVLPPCTSGTVVEIGDVNLTAGEHIIGFNLTRESYAIDIKVKGIYFEKVGSLNTIAFRATDYEQALEYAIAAEYNKFDGNYDENAVLYGKSTLWTNGGTVLEYDLGITKSGTYTLSAMMQENEGSITVLTGNDYASAKAKISDFDVATAPQWTDDEELETALITIGDVEIAAGEKLYIKCTKVQIHLYHFELEHITPIACIEEVNECKDPYKVKEILAKYNGSPIDEVNEKLNSMYFTAFIGAELINKNFASFDELLEAFNTAYEKEAEENNLTLISVSYGGKVVNDIVYNSDYKIKIKKNALEEGTTVILVSYTNSGAMRKAVVGVVEKDKELEVGNVWINPGEKYGIFFWNSLGLVKPKDIFTLAVPVKTVFVSEGGDDTLSGTTAGSPLKTLSAAKLKAIEIAEQTDSDVLVKLQSGTYYLTETLNFTEEENARKKDNIITFKGTGKTQPLISGGARIKGWVKMSDGVYKASLPESISDVRQLYIDGEIRNRAKSKYTYGALDYHYASEEDKTAEKPDGIIVSGINFPEFSNAEDVEFVYDILWANQRVAVKSITKEDEKIVVLMEQPYYSWALNKNYPGTAPAKGARFYIENAIEFLDEDGEFYFDKTKNEIYYRPYENENPNFKECYVPCTEFLIKNEGFDGLVLENLDFRHGAWTKPGKQGVTGFQADALIGETVNASGKNDAVDMLPAQLSFKNADNIQIKNCSFINLASGAIALLGETQNSLIEGNIIRDISGTGIIVGEWGKDYAEVGDEAPCRSNVIKNNVIKRTAQEYYGSVGVAVYYANDISILNNDISELPYTAISLGWGWGVDRYKSGGHVIKQNKLSDACNVFSDGGLVYMLGSMPGTEVSENYLTDCPGYGGIYFDQGSADITAKNNVLANCKNWLQGGTAEAGAEGSEYVVERRRIVQSNYADKEDWAYKLLGGVTGLADTTSVIEKAIIYDQAAPDEAVSAIINNAGISEEYAGLLEAEGIHLSRTSHLAHLPRERFVPQDTKIINASQYSDFHLNNPNRTEPDIFNHGGVTVVGNIQWRDELEYKVDFDTALEKELLFRYARTGIVDDTPDVEIFVNGTSVGSFVLPSVSSYQDFATINVGTISLGTENTIRFVFQGGVSFKEIELKNPNNVQDTSFDDGIYVLPE